MRVPGKPQLVALTILLGTISTGLAQSPKPEPTPAAPPIRLALTSLVPDATFEFAGDLRFASAQDAIWVSSRTTGKLTRIDTKTNKPGVSVEAGKEPCSGIVSAFRSLWVPLCGANSLARIEPPVEPAAAAAKPEAKLPDAKPAEAKPAETKPADAKPAEDKPSPKPITLITTGIRGVGALVSATGSIWIVTDSKGTLARIDPDTNAVVAEVTVAAGATNIVAAGDALWVTSPKGVSRVNGYTNVVEETIKVGPSPLAVASGEGAVWVLNGGDGSVSKIDPKTNKVTETIKAGSTGTTGSIVVAEGSVWLSTPGFPLSRIDPKTNRLAQQFTGPGGGVLLVAQKSIWLNATPTHVWRIDPRRVEATRK
jgi:virginiamycin B lyase